MNTATRTSIARLYDLNPNLPDDLPFYRSRLPARDGSVLELGCGTGRVLVPLARHCRYAHGVDVSEEMIESCGEKLRSSGLPASRAVVERGDIADLRLGLRFDRIIAPYRVVQHLETDRQIDGLFRGVRDHLAPGGRCVLDAFRPDPVQLLEWPEDAEIFGWGVAADEERVTCHFRKNRIDADRQVLYPHLIYRRYRGRDLVEETVLDMVVRYYSAGQFDDLVTGHGFRIVRRWGGYADEEYGVGPELILEFARAMTFLLLLPAILSALLLGAHFLRGGHILLVLGCLAVPALLVLRRRWVARLTQVVLLAGAVEWVRTLAGIVLARRVAGEPWLRVVFILGAVALLTAASTLVFRAAPLRRRYGLDQDARAE